MIQIQFQESATRCFPRSSDQAPENNVTSAFCPPPTALIHQAPQHPTEKNDNNAPSLAPAPLRNPRRHPRQLLHLHEPPPAVCYLTFAMTICGILSPLLCRFASNEDLCLKSVAICLLPQFPLALLFFYLVSPVAGIWKSKIMDLHSGDAAHVYVQRPFFGRKRCESKHGVTGGNPTMEGLTNSKKRIRYEPALVIVNWLICRPQSSKYSAKG